MPDMVADPQTLARGFFVTYERYGVPMPGNPIKMAGLDTAEWRACPRLGEHNAEVLSEWLGMAPEQVDRLTRDGVLADIPPG